ncbi:hypothetical protein AAG570_007814 [Ranatra chinensis]|uniref:Protein FMC1 homolog n=1 Tax=Ranatra chinensis TaxID=642074 RepID=A0ABD0XUL1_9HEMI
MNPRLCTLRHLLSELRACSSSKKLYNQPFTAVIMENYRKNQVTELQLCNAKDEWKYVVDAYVIYLQSQRKYKQLLKEYKVNHSYTNMAGFLGFKLPEDPE